MRQSRTRSPLAVWVCSIAATILITSSCLAGSQNNRTGTTAFSFLKMHSGARAQAMGGAATGLADDLSSLYFNPGGLPATELKIRYIGAYQNYFDGLQSGYIAGGRRVNDKTSLGLHVNYLNYGEFTRTDENANVLGEFSGSDIVIGLTVARRFSYYVSAGATVKGVYQKVDQFSASGVALDLGAKYTANRERFTIGAAVQHLGTQLSSMGSDKAPLPVTGRIGGSIKPIGLHTIFATDLFVSLDRNLGFALGAEVQALDPLYVRAGWNSYGLDTRGTGSTADFAGTSLGLGVRLKSIHISYAFSLGGDLGDIHRVSISGGR